VQFSGAHEKASGRLTAAQNNCGCWFFWLFWILRKGALKKRWGHTHPSILCGNGKIRGVKREGSKRRAREQILTFNSYPLRFMWKSWRRDPSYVQTMQSESIGNWKIFRWCREKNCKGRGWGSNNILLWWIFMMISSSFIFYFLFFY